MLLENGEKNRLMLDILNNASYNYTVIKIGGHAFHGTIH